MKTPQETGEVVATMFVQCLAVAVFAVAASCPMPTPARIILAVASITLTIIGFNSQSRIIDSGRWFRGRSRR